VLDVQIDSFLDTMYGLRGCSAHTVKAYSEDLGQLATFLESEGVTDAAGITLSHLRAFLAHLQQQELARTTRARKTAAIRSFFDHLVKQGTIPQSPAAGLRTVKTEKRLPKFLRGEEIEALMRAPDSSPLGLRDRALLETLYASGMRAAELVSVDVDDIDFPSASVRVIGKGNKERVTLLGKHATDALEIYLAQGRPSLLLNGRQCPAAGHKKAHGDALFVNRYGERISDRGVRKLFTRYCEVASTHLKLTPHVMRHTFATHMLAGGADLRLVQELLGHSSLATTQIYTHVTTERLQEAHKKAHPRKIEPPPETS